MPEGHVDRLRRLHVYGEEADSRGSISTAISRRAGGRNSSSWARARIRRRNPKCALSSTSSSRHPNITGGTAFHTWSGVLLRPFEHLPGRRDACRGPVGLPGDRQEGHRADRLSRRSPVYHEFRYHPKSVIGGTFDWLYEHLGIFSWVVEIWSPMREAGISRLQVHRLVSRPPGRRTTCKLIRWSDDELGGLAHVAWKPFDHPQLGKVEIGGWNRFHAFSNPPPPLLERELAALPEVAALAGADLAEARTRARRRRDRGGAGAWKVTLVVQNTGWLPAYVSKRALARKTVRGLIAEIALPRRRDAGARASARVDVRPARRQGVQAHRRVVLAGLQRHRRPREGRMGRRAATRATIVASSRGTSAQERARRRCSSSRSARDAACNRRWRIR